MIGDHTLYITVRVFIDVPVYFSGLGNIKPVMSRAIRAAGAIVHYHSAATTGRFKLFFDLLNFGCKKMKCWLSTLSSFLVQNLPV